MRERSNSKKRPHDGEHEVSHGESSPVKSRPSLTNSTHAFACQALDQGAQVEVAGEPVPAVHDQGVAVSGEPQQFGELWPGRCPGRMPCL
jgi:hypothetical protein